MASEQSARMVAMKAATDNAGSVIKELQLVYNKARQAAISRLMRDEAMHRALGEAPGAEALYALLSNSIEKDAA